MTNHESPARAALPDVPDDLQGSSMGQLLSKVRAALVAKEADEARRLLAEFDMTTCRFESDHTEPDPDFDYDHGWDHGDWRSQREYEEAIEAGDVGNRIEPAAAQKIWRCRVIADAYRRALLEDR